MKSAEWIWLPGARAPELQHTKHTVFDSREVPFAVVQFKKKFAFASPISRATLHISGDCRFRLIVNGNYIGMGPPFSGGDWARVEPMPQRYYDTYSFDNIGKSLLLLAEVQLCPTMLCDISNGSGGFFLEGDILLTDGTCHTIGTDSSWYCRVSSQWKNDLFYDASAAEEAWNIAEASARPRPLPSEIPVCEHRIIPLDGSGEAEMIYTGTLICDIEASEPSELRLIPYETPDLEDEAEVIRTGTPVHYEGFRIRSVGGIRVEITAGHPVIHHLSVRAVSYPGSLIGECITDDKSLNQVMTTCAHTLKICRQSIHLDSPRHMEPLGCTGDYYVESLMEYYCFDDHRLTRFDIVRTGRLLEATGGIMFHTGYSLMWVSMLKDYVLYTGDSSVISEVEPAIRILLEKFHSYEDAEGLLDNPPNYMFADWVEISGYSMHHPPKALGQTILNALYYRALRTGSRLLREPLYEQRAEKVKAAFSRSFWDDKRLLFFSGKTGSTVVNEWLPQNAPTPIFTLHANAMAVACGIIDGPLAVQVMNRILTDSSLPDYQPYFAHFVFHALWKTNLFEEHAIPLFRRWIPMVENCSKGLAEGWIAPCDGYIFDHSHAWGGCPRYWLPRALIGLDILEPGFKTIRLLPRLKMPGNSTVTVPTPHGLLTCEVQDGIIRKITSPKEITILSGES